MPEEQQTTRMTVIISQDLYDRLVAAVPHGYRQHVLNPVIELVVNAIEDHGPIVIGHLMSGQFKLVRDESVETT